MTVLDTLQATKSVISINGMTKAYAALTAVSTLLLLLTQFALAVVAYVLRRMGESTDDVAATFAGG